MAGISMASADNVEKLHNLFASSIRDLTALHPTIRSPIEGWKRVVKGTRVSFEMVCRGHTTTATRRKGGRCPVFPVSRQEQPFDDQAWAGWHEEWHCVQHNDFDLIGVGWTFFWGRDGRLGRDQEILRAEWDQIPETEHQKYRRGGLVAQPHWHLDTAIMAGYSRPATQVAHAREAVELDEIVSDTRHALMEIGPPVGIQELDISGMHLGMGGWYNHDSHPRCWQMIVGEDWKNLVLWAGNTLQSARDQLRNVVVTQVAP
jgi:hypothetical protein